jgi:hypothetical protein
MRLLTAKFRLMTSGSGFRFLKGTPRKIELTDEYFTEIETLLRAAFDKTFALAVKIGATKLADETP